MDLVNAYLDGNRIVLLSRDEKGELVTKGVSPEYVVYLNANEVDGDFSRQLSKSRFVKSFKREGEWIRVGWSDRFIRDDMLFGRKGDDKRISPFEERGIKTYEGDVHPVRRYITDNDVTIQRPRRCYLDIETDSRVPFSRKEEMRILSWALVNQEGERWSAVLQADDDFAERDLLWELFQVAQDYDQILAWSGDGFDFPVIRSRVEKRSININMDRWLWLDHLLLFKRMNTAAESGDEKTSMKLQSVAMSILGEGKTEFDAGKTYQAWAAGGSSRELLLKYNEQDTDLLRKIEAKTGSAALFDTVAQVMNVFPDSRGLNSTVQMDGYMLKEGMKSGVHFATKKYKENLFNEKFEGAYVMEPISSGIDRDVHVCDFASLYPSIILTWNMSPETKAVAAATGDIPTGLCRSPSTKQHFKTYVEGILPAALKKMLNLRKEWNAKKASLPPGTPDWYEADRRSTAYKVVANSFYGVIGSNYSRFFDRTIAESVTLNGQWLLKSTLEQADKRGISTIYADTDSLFCKGCTRTEFEEFVRWCNEDFYPKALKDLGCEENFVKLAYEKQFRRIAFVGKKRYAGQYEHYKGKAATADSKPEVKGLEYKRGDTALLARRLQEQVIHKMIVEGDSKPETFRELLGNYLQRILYDTLPVEEVQITKSLSKPLKEYLVKKKGDGEEAASPPHVRVARVLEQRGEEVNEGTRIAYVVLDGDGGINVPISAMDYDGTFDRYYFWENMIYPPTQRLLQAAFPESNWVAGLEKIRPPKLKGKKVGEGQLGLLIETEKPNVLTGKYPVAISEFYGKLGAEKIKEVALRHPGGLHLEIHVHLDSGSVAVMSTPVKVSGSPAMVNEIAAALHEVAELKKWESNLLCMRHLHS